MLPSHLSWSIPVLRVGGCALCSMDPGNCCYCREDIKSTPFTRIPHLQEAVDGIEQRTEEFNAKREADPDRFIFTRSSSGRVSAMVRLRVDEEKEEGGRKGLLGRFNNLRGNKEGGDYSRVPVADASGVSEVRAAKMARTTQPGASGAKISYLNEDGDVVEVP